MRVKTVLKRLTKKYHRRIGAIYVNTRDHQMYCLVSIPTSKARIWKKIPPLFPLGE